jgi:YegS/Rv2252/BmrU family lipid kinase
MANRKSTVRRLSFRVRICVIFNPAARGEKARRFRAHLAALTGQCVLKPTPAAGAGRALAAEAVREGHDVIVAAGGDGTLNEVVNGIADAPEGLSRARLGVLPLGTVNVFAKELGLPTAFDGAWAVIERGRELQVDLAEAVFEGGAKSPHRFVQMAGAGWDTRAIELVDWGDKKRFGTLAYVVAGLKALRGPLPLIRATNGKETLAGQLVLIGNGRYYGGRWVLFPRADLRDGLLDVTVFPRMNWAWALRGGLGVLARRAYTVGGLKHFQAASIRLTSDSPALFEVEGENIGRLPVQISVRSRALRVIVP